MARKEAIIDALGEAREHLILSKYNQAMMLMAQITIDVIGHLTDEALIVSKGYEEDLNMLASIGVIASDTVHNFETLIISGVQAHNGVNIPKEHAEKAFEVLSNELDSIFKKEEMIPQENNFDNKKNRDFRMDKNTPVFEYDEDNEAPYPGDFSRDMGAEGDMPAFFQMTADGDFRKKERMREKILSKEREKSKVQRTSLIAIIAPIALVLMLVFAVKAMFFSGGGENSNINIEPSTLETYSIETTETTEPQIQIPEEAGYYEVTGDLVKIRDKATTEGSKVIGLVNKGEVLDIREFYDDDWAVVFYEAELLYVSRLYIKKNDVLSVDYAEKLKAAMENSQEALETTTDQIEQTESGE